MTVGVVWEFFEYGMDVFFHTDMQKDTWISAISSVSLNPDGRNVAEQVAVDSVVVNGQSWPAYLDIGLHDTMKDLLVNFVGAVLFSIIGALYIMGRARKIRAPLHPPLKGGGAAPSLGGTGAAGAHPPGGRFSPGGAISGGLRVLLHCAGPVPVL